MTTELITDEFIRSKYDLNEHRRSSVKVVERIYFIEQVLRAAGINTNFDNNDNDDNIYEQNLNLPRFFSLLRQNIPDEAICSLMEGKVHLCDGTWDSGLRRDRPAFEITLTRKQTVFETDDKVITRLRALELASRKNTPKGGVLKKKKPTLAEKKKAEEQKTLLKLAKKYNVKVDLPGEIG